MDREIESFKYFQCMSSVCEFFVDDFSFQYVTDLPLRH